MDIIVGTAGHIDHGKTALVKALTGVNADRLPEERKRGITIDLGFAELDLDEVKIGFVDVPGHEKFVKNMLAGASGIDIVVLAVAADEGVMPQTREHFEICRLLGTKRGVIALTKKDLVDEEFIELVKIDVAEMVENSFLENAPIVEVSSKTGEGIGDFKEKLREMAAGFPLRKNEFITRLPIDRAFSITGFGAVVTGTLATGAIVAGSELELLPSAQRVRVRGLQTHGREVEKANSGQRTAVNLGGINHDEIERGMVLSEPGISRSTQIINAEVEVLKDWKHALKSRQRVRVHIGTVEAFARLQVLNSANEISPGGRDFMQIRFEAPVSVIPNETFILRQYSPQVTIAGGKVLDAHARKTRKPDIEKVRAYLVSLSNALKEDDQDRIVKLFLEKSEGGGFEFDELQNQTGYKSDVLKGILNRLEEKKAVVLAERFYVARTPFDQLKVFVLEKIEKHHKSEPLSKGILRETLREKTASHIPAEIFRAVLERLQNEGNVVFDDETVRASSHNLDLTEDENRAKEELIDVYRNADLLVPKLSEALEVASKKTGVSIENSEKIFRLLVNSGEIEKVSEEFFFTKESIDYLVRKVKSYADGSKERLIGVPEFKDLAGVSRKYAIPLLEYMDAKKITRRAGDKRMIL